MKELSNDILIKLASEIAGIEKKERENLPYNANIIEDIKIKENAHSRILTTLLNYAGHDHSFPVYQIFIDLLKKKCCSIKDITIHNPNITAEKERIDILIDESHESPSYSIIIENKVCWADDQFEQIERYIKKVQGHNVPNESIFVIYLTKYGNKKVSDKSLTQKAKDILDYDDKKLCRFIELNYKDDLLPMFISSANQIDRDKEPLLHSSLIQYVDYWKGKFSMRNGEKKIAQKIAKYMADKLNVNSIQDCLKIADNLESLQNALDKKRNELMKQVLNEKVVEPLKKYLGKDYEFDLLENCIRITPIRWTVAYIYIGTSSDNTIIIGVYGRKISNVASASLESVDYEKDIWCKGEQGYNKDVVSSNIYSSEFWDLVDNGKILKVLKKDIKELITLLEGKRL